LPRRSSARIPAATTTQERSVPDTSSVSVRASNDIGAGWQHEPPGTGGACRIRRIPHGLFYEDFDEGRQFHHHWGRTFSESDAIWYATFSLQYNAIYFNRQAAVDAGFRDLIVHPIFVFTTALGLSVEDLSEAGGPFLGVEDVHHLAPTYPGDTIYAHSTVVSRRLTASRAGWGVVEWATHAVNQDGVRVVEYHRRNLSKQRAPQE
jgi:itaconyl-CoA hydratase